MLANNLSEQLESIAGVASVDVELGTNSVPIARVYLDGTRDAAEVQREVDAVLGSSGAAAQGPVRRRGGLGRNLAEIIDANGDEPSPLHVQGSPSSVVSGLRSVAVVETADGVSVEAQDALGERRSVRIGDAMPFDRAVVTVVAQLLGSGRLAEVAVHDVTTDGTEIVVVSLVSGVDRKAGASHVDVGRAWAIAAATAQALGSG